MADFYNTLTVLFLTASAALVWLNWRAWQGKKVTLPEAADQERASSRPSPSILDGPAPLKLQIGGPVPPVPSAAKTSEQVLPEPGAGTAAVTEADLAFLQPAVPNWRSEPRRQRTAEPSPEPSQNPAVDIENWVASLEAVVRGHSSRRD